MKKIYFLVFAFCFINGLSAQIINFPDANFKAKLLEAGVINDIGHDINNNRIKIDLNNDGEIQVDEALTVYQLDIPSSQISNLIGIEKFINLNLLDCRDNQLTSLDVNALTDLESLNCGSNQLTNLDLSTLSFLHQVVCNDNILTNLTLVNSINRLDFRNNLLTNLNLSGLINLTDLNCSNNMLTELNVIGLDQLEFLDCSKNNISDLNLIGMSNLHYLDCYENSLTNLNLSGLSNLQEIDCSNNKLTDLKVNANLNLADLYCANNQLSNLDLTGLVNLGYLAFSENQLTSIDLKGLANLVYISFLGNQISTIDFSNSPKITNVDGGKNPIESIDLSLLPNLETLWLGYTPLHSLDLSNSNKLIGINISSCPNLESINLKNGSPEDLNYLEPELLDYFKTDCSNFSNCPKLKYICGDEGELESISQKTASYNYANCVVGGYCSFDDGAANYTIRGNNRIDSDRNGCDASDLPASNIKFAISDGIETGTVITNDSGNYSIKVKEGTYAVTPVLENSNYFTISPSSLNVTFPTDATPFIKDFCITPIGSHKDLEITLIPMEVARPGFDSKYKLVYKNKGNVTQSGTVNFAFDDAVLDVVVSNPVVSSQNTNNLSWNFSDLKPFETREITFTLNVNSPMEIPAVNSGNVLHYTAIVNSADVDENPNDNMFVLNHTVVGSLDPNDKTCLEGDIITPSLIEEYVHYLIRFENTGNYAAQNIVVKDRIDLSKFDISTLVPTDASHSYITKISDGNKVEFIFENINLPFDDANNDGYIAFKIKTNSTLKVGDSFENTADIFFDYNFPVETNTAKTTYKTTLGKSDFEFSKYFSVYPIPAATVLNISAKSTIDIQSVSIYNVMGQIVLAIPNAEKITAVDVSNLSSGNYFIRIKSDKGSSSLKFIKN